jgi:hypothetical protein
LRERVTKYSASPEPSVINSAEPLMLNLRLAGFHVLRKTSGWKSPTGSNMEMYNKQT